MPAHQSMWDVMAVQTDTVLKGTQKVEMLLSRVSGSTARLEKLEILVVWRTPSTLPT